MNRTRRVSSSNSKRSRYSSARTLRSSNIGPLRTPDRDPEELQALLFQLTTPFTQIRRPRMERPSWTIREARATLRSFVRKIGTLEGTSVWSNPEFQRDLVVIRDSATGRISHAALQHAFTQLKQFADKWYSDMSSALFRQMSEDRHPLFSR